MFTECRTTLGDVQYDVGKFSNGMTANICEISSEKSSSILRLISILNVPQKIELLVRKQDCNDVNFLFSFFDLENDTVFFDEKIAADWKFIQKRATIRALA